MQLLNPYSRIDVPQHLSLQSVASVSPLVSDHLLENAWGNPVLALWNTYPNPLGTYFRAVSP